MGKNLPADNAPIIAICPLILTAFSDLEIDARIQEQAMLHGFALQGHSLELYGLCKDCRGR